MTRLTVAQALVRFLARQYTERDGHRQRLIAATWGIFGHGNVAGIGQALAGGRPGRRCPSSRAATSRPWCTPPSATPASRGRLSAHAVTTSIGPGATNLVTGAALATINRLPVLLLPGDTFATRPADPVLQQLEVPYAGDVSVNDALRPVSRYFDRVTRPEALIPAALAAMRVLADPVETGAVTLALPQDVQAEAYDWPEEFFAERVWRRPPPRARPRRTRRGRPGRAAPPPAADRRRRRGPAQRGRGRPCAAFAERHRHPGRLHPGRQGRRCRYDHPADVGGIGHTGTATADELARTADLVIGVGTRWTDFTTASATLFPNPAVRFLNLNIDRLRRPQAGRRCRWSPTPATGLDALTDGARPATGSTRRTRPSTRDGKERWEHRVDAAYAVRRRGPPAPPRPRCSGCSTPWSTTSDILINAAGSLPGDLHKLWRARSPRPVPRRVRLLLHGLRDPRRHRRAAGRARPARSGRWSATARI